MPDIDPSEMAQTLVLNMLRGIDAPTTDQIRERATLVVGMLRAQSPDIALDFDTLVREVEARCSVWVPSSLSLDDDRDHVEWFADRRGEIEWRFWERYERYLRDEERWAPATIGRMSQTTDDVLRRIEDPRRSDSWDRRGMVAGQVQSGKTANYIGLICKAADSGYRLIVVLAGLHNSLRAQTQVRVDEGFLGFDTQRRMKFDQSNVRMGVGALPGAQLYHASSLTNSSDSGDFRVAVANQVGITPGGADPIVLVVKKNKSILENLTKWATLVLQQKDPSGKHIVRDVPLLVIDDEADNASVNTRAAPVDETGKPVDEFDPTIINGLIRDLLQRFDKSAYVGYTATPFANIFIPSGTRSTKFGEDLFPRSFIINLRAPSDYVGPAEVFGLRADTTAGLEERSGLPVIRPITDHDLWLPDGHKKEASPGALPDSLKTALRSFLIACAIRRARGQQNVHNSMLVHVTRFVAVQERVAQQISEELTYLTRRLRYGDGGSSGQLRAELEALFHEDFLTTWRAFPEQRRARMPSWEEVDRELFPAASRAEVIVINGTAKDVLQYIEQPSGLTAIVVGGDKLSRGLTLEGLTVSYYLRASKMYDTLMQMGRWFGYRPNYADVCRLYTTSELVASYREITVANEELRQRFDQMALVGGTPEDFWLGVRNSPDMLITAHAKMRHGQTVMLSYSDNVSETLAYHTDSGIRRRNFDLCANFTTLLDKTATRKEELGRVVWRNASGKDVLTFVEAFVTHEDARRARSAVLAAYIRARLLDDELRTWTVALLEGSSDETAQLAGDRRRLVVRNADPIEDGVVRIDRLVSPKDEMIDLDDADAAEALEKTVAAWKVNPGRYQSEPKLPSGHAIRATRKPAHGLLLLYPFDSGRALEPKEPPLIGLAVSFPRSERAEPVEYTVNNVYWQQEFGF